MLVRTLLLLAATATFGAIAADSAGGVQYFTAAEVDTMRASGETGGTLITDPEFKVMAARRDKAGQSEVHAKDTDIFIVAAGRATIVIGGEVIDPKEVSPGETRGTGILGGKDYLLEKGVVLTVPRGTPHWIRETRPGFQYFVVKVVARK